MGMFSEFGEEIFDFDGLSHNLAKQATSSRGQEWPSSESDAHGYTVLLNLWDPEPVDFSTVLLNMWNPEPVDLPFDDAGREL